MDTRGESFKVIGQLAKCVEDCCEGEWRLDGERQGGDCLADKREETGKGLGKTGCDALNAW